MRNKALSALAAVLLACYIGAVVLAVVTGLIWPMWAGAVILSAVVVLSFFVSPDNVFWNER